ncbi:KRAB-A domain-containing protein 2-like [Penaeus monodon]|uniref:KRAB-A domain-containing protein 2-like n=1 Tax=Penaeus monodon TaxID=6687 RepID=UPI0018A79A64|nr:KRAB-A domain-containing protein 2-like [Penaeus monodon]
MTSSRWHTLQQGMVVLTEQSAILGQCRLTSQKKLLNDSNPCITCQEKRKRNKTAGGVVKPLLSSEFNSLGQVDLVDMQPLPQAHFSWIMVYQCHLTKFVILRALTSKRAAEVSFQLLDIFHLFGAPAILQSDNGSGFTAKTKTSANPGFSRTSPCDIKDMFHALRADNKTQDWSVGLRFVQHQKKSAHHFGNKRTPFKALFGTDPKSGSGIIESSSRDP